MMVCRVCRGQKKCFGLGYVFGECKACKGTGVQENGINCPETRELQQVSSIDPVQRIGSKSIPRKRKAPKTKTEKESLPISKGIILESCVTTESQS